MNREATHYGLADYRTNVYFVTGIDVPLNKYGGRLREFWHKSHPELEEWFDGPDPMFVYVENDGATRRLWVKDAWLSQ